MLDSLLANTVFVRHSLTLAITRAEPTGAG